MKQNYLVKQAVKHLENAFSEISELIDILDNSDDILNHISEKNNLTDNIQISIENIRYNMEDIHYHIQNNIDEIKQDQNLPLLNKVLITKGSK